ncbi:MAG: ATP-binding protein, partial [Gammaproteobacteria bacterium]
RDDALRASQAKSSFLTNMSHELRTPLNAIIGYSEMLEEEASDEGMDDFCTDLAKITGAGNHLLTLINNVLDLSKIEAGRMELDINEFSINSLLGDIESICLPLVSKNHNEFVLDCPDDIGLMKADIVKIRQAVLNLIGNASKFTENGKITLKVSSSVVDGCERIAFSVSDTGIGMTAEQVDKVFKEFTQADATTTRKYGGTGLGLAISKRFSEMMGGKIEVSSELNKGSTFTLHIPKVVNTPAPATPVQARTTKERRNSVSNVLVIDESNNTRKFIQEQLHQNGFAVMTAPSSGSVLKMVTKLTPNAIVVNVQTSDTDFMDVIKQANSVPEFQKVPVFLVSLSDDLSAGFALRVSHVIDDPDNEGLVALSHEFKGSPDKSVLVVDNHEATLACIDSEFKSITPHIQHGTDDACVCGCGKEHKPCLMILDPFCVRNTDNELLVNILKDRTINTTPVVLINYDPSQITLFRERLKSLLKAAEYASDEFIENFTHQMADSQRSSQV